MPGGFDIDKLSIIYAEDDLVFREIAVPAIVKAGVNEDKILQAEDGVEALDHLNKLQDGNPTEPIVMLLDVRMPHMDGNQCAAKVKELIDGAKLKRLPFLVCCSAGVEQVSFGGENGSDNTFHITMPKPFSDKEVNLVLKKAKEWWSAGGGGSGSASDARGAGGAGASVDLSTVDTIVGDNEPICRMALITALTLLGLDEDLVTECEDADEVLEAVKKSQAKGSKPLLLFLGNPTWISTVTKLAADAKKPFCVSTSMDDCSDPNFHANLPRQFSQADLKNILDQGCAWWSKR